LPARADPGVALLREGLDIDPLQGLKEVEGSPEDRDAVAVRFLGQDTKSLTTDMPLVSPLLDKKPVQLVIGVAELLSFLRPGDETSLTAGESQLIDLASFMFVPQGPELLDVLLDQGIASTNIIDDPGRRAEKAEA
jgi:hypothetical protein